MTMPFIYIVFFGFENAFTFRFIYLFQNRIKYNKQDIYYRHFTIMGDEQERYFQF